MVVIISAIAELERSLIVECVRAGMRRARLEGRRIGRAPLNGRSLTQIAKTFGIGRASVSHHQMARD